MPLVYRLLNKLPKKPWWGTPPGLVCFPASFSALEQLLADVDWNDTDMPLSNDPTLPRLWALSPATKFKLGHRQAHSYNALNLHCSCISNKELLKADRLIWDSWATSSEQLSDCPNVWFCEQGHWWQGYTSTSATPLSLFSVPRTHA